MPPKGSRKVNGKGGRGGKAPAAAPRKGRKAAASVPPPAVEDEVEGQHDALEGEDDAATAAVVAPLKKGRPKKAKAAAEEAPVEVKSRAQRASARCARYDVPEAEPEGRKRKRKPQGGNGGEEDGSGVEKEAAPRKKGKTGKKAPGSRRRGDGDAEGGESVNPLRKPANRKEDDAATDDEQPKGPKAGAARAGPAKKAPGRITPARAQATRLKLRRENDEDLKESVKSNREKASRKREPTWPAGVKWEGAQPLGAGGFGATYLWRGTDESGNEVHKIMVKDCYVSASIEQDIIHWVGDPRDFEKREHAEIVCMQRVAEHPDGQRYCVALRSHDLDRARRWYRLYMDYCPHGSLHEIIEIYTPQRHMYLRQEGVEVCKKCGQDRPKEVRPAGIDEMEDEEKISGERFIPEPFLWYVFEALARACVAMDNIASGSGKGKERAPDGWCIVHRDLKPGNIFLDSPQSTDDDEDAVYPSYPRPRVGDFGISFMTHAKDPFNPLGYMLGQGTPGWVAPETMPLVDPFSADYVDIGRIDGKANIWGVGAIVGAMISRESAYLNNHDYLDPLKKLPRIRIPRDAKERNMKLYSTALLELVNRCLAYRPADRPSADEVLAEILDHTDAGDEGVNDDGVEDGDAVGEDKARGMRRNAVPRARENDRLLFLRYQPDKYLDWLANGGEVAEE